VFDDATLASTLPILAAGVTTFAGQNCMAGSRILVQRGIADQVRERLAERLTRVVVGSGEQENTEMGPLIDSAAVARVDRIVEDSASYARVIVRGGPVNDGPLVSGAFYRPSLIEVEDPTHRSSSKKSSGRSPHSRSSTVSLAILRCATMRGSSSTSPWLCWNWRASVIRPGSATDVAINPS